MARNNKNKTGKENPPAAAKPSKRAAKRKREKSVEEQEEIGEKEAKGPGRGRKLNAFLSGWQHDLFL